MITKQSPIHVPHTYRPRKPSWPARLLVIICLLAMVFAPLPYPAVGLKRAVAFSVGDEKLVGEKLLSIVRRNFKLIEEPDILQYITGLGNEVLTVTDAQYFKYNFFVINQKEFNAFAAPSGLIFAYSGLIETMDTEGELLSVLAHETAHVTNRHIARQAEKSKTANIASMVLVLAGIAMGGGDLSQAMIVGGMAAGTSMQLRYSRQDEEEADRMAYDWLVAMHRDPSEMIAMLRKMYRVNAISMNQTPPYLLTHPEPSQRIGYVQDLRRMSKPGPFPARAPFQFKRMKYRLLSITRDPAALLEHLLPASEANQSNAKDDQDGMRFYGISQAYLENAQFDQARAALQRVINDYPDQPILLTDLGRTYYEEGRYDTALEYFNQARDKLPGDAFTAYYLARTLQQQGKPTEALKLYNEILLTVPNLTRLHYQIGEIKSQQGDPAAGHYHLGLYHWFEGDAETARFHLNQTIKLAGEQADIKLQANEMLTKITELEKI